MTPLRPRHLFFLALIAAAYLAGIRIYAPEVDAPGTSPVVSSSPSASTPGAGLYGPVPVTAPRPLPPGEEASPQIAALEKNDPELFRQKVEDTLAQAVREKFPEARLSDREVAELAETIRTLRESFAGLQELKRTPENAAAIAALAGQVEQGIRSIEMATGMNVAGFLSRITTEGIDNEKPEKGEVVLEYLDSPGR